MNPLELFDSPTALRLATAFLHFLWQGALLGVGAWILALVLRKRSANARYLVYTTTLFLMTMCVPATFFFLESSELLSGIPPNTHSETETLMRISESTSATPTVAATEVKRTTALNLRESNDFGATFSELLPHLMLAYTLGAFFLLVRLLFGFGGGQRLRNLSQPVEDPVLLGTLKVQAERLGLAFVPAISYCREAAVPTVIGVLRPTLLLPLSFASGLSNQQVELVLCHELAHIRRLDPLLNFIQRIIEAILFFHPAVWFVSQRMRTEREHCCDDLVLGLGGDRQTYITTLIELATHSFPQVSPEAVHATRGPSQLRRRILRMLGERGHEGMRLKRIWVAVCMAIALIGIFPLTAETDQDGERVVPMEAKLIETDSMDAQISGFVVNRHSGEPITDFEIGVIKYDPNSKRGKWERSREQIARRFQDSEGRFDLAIPNLGLEIADIAFFATGYVDPLVMGNSLLPGQQKVDTTVHMSREDHIRGTVVDTKGIPVESARVIPFSENNVLFLGTEYQGRQPTTWGHEAITDASGYFQLGGHGVENGIHHFHIAKEGEGAIFSINHEIGDSNDPFRLVLQPAGVVEGALDYEGKPLVNEDIVLINTGDDPLTLMILQFRSRTKTDDQGRFQFEGIPAGDYEVIHQEEGSEWRDRNKLEVRPGEPVTANLLGTEEAKVRSRAFLSKADF